MSPQEWAKSCFPIQRRQRSVPVVDGVSLCEVCWSLVPIGDAPDWVPSIDGLSPIQSGHVAWHAIATPGGDDTP